MNAKAKGTRNEHKTIRLLEALGYACTRSAASLGVWDVVAIGPADVLLIQCKSNKWPSAVEMEAMELFRSPPHCRKLIHRWNDRQRLPDIREVL